MFKVFLMLPMTVLLFLTGCDGNTIQTTENTIPEKCGNNLVAGEEICDGNVMQCTEIDLNLYISGKAKCLKDCTGWDVETCVEKDDSDSDVEKDDTDTGDSGNSGNTGNTGNSGDTGDTGDSGNTGDTGNTGNTGNTGDTGDSGDTGEDWTDHECYDRTGDADGDGILNEIECPDFPCKNTDGDLKEDCLDIDSDSDGLPDKQEVYCVTLGIYSSLQSDTDEDGDGDLAEIMLGSDPCDGSNAVADTGHDVYFELPYEESSVQKIVEFRPSVKKADILFNVDTTGSMGDEISALKNSLKAAIIPGVGNIIPDSAFGVSYYDDFPVNGYGTGSDRPFGLLQSPTTDQTVAQSGVEKLALHNGGDGPESGYESLYKIATGAALSWNGGSVAEGVVGFRDGTIPIVVHITDAVAHDVNNTPFDSSFVYSIFSHDQTVTALKNIGAKVISVLSAVNSAAKTQLTNISDSTGATAPTCAGAGRTTLVYEIGSNGSGLDTAVISGINALINYSSFAVYAKTDETVLSDSVMTACFVEKIESYQAVAADECVAPASESMFDGAEYNNGFSNFSRGSGGGSILRFKLNARNLNCFEATDEAKLFTAYVNIIDEASGGIMDTKEIPMIVPVK